MTEYSTSMNMMEDLSSDIRFAIYDCKMYFLKIGFILENIKKSLKFKKNVVKKMTTIWEDPYM
jgi:hypothetical protein